MDPLLLWNQLEKSSVAIWGAELPNTAHFYHSKPWMWLGLIPILKWRFLDWYRLFYTLVTLNLMRRVTWQYRSVITVSRNNGFFLLSSTLLRITFKLGKSLHLKYIKCFYGLISLMLSFRVTTLEYLNRRVGQYKLAAPRHDQVEQ